MKKINFILIAFFFLVSCGDVGKILRNEKIRSTDEFLVKKKGPLVLPPDYEIVPVPGSISKKEVNEEDKFKEILRDSKKGNQKQNESSSVEESILKNIRKWLKKTY